MIVANLKLVEDLVDPDHASAGIAEQVIVKTGVTRRGGLPEAGNQVFAILL